MRAIGKYFDKWLAFSASSGEDVNIPTQNAGPTTTADNLYLESEINATYDNDTNVLQTDGNSTSIKEDEVYL